MTEILEQLKSLASVDLFKEGKNAAQFIGRPFYFDYEKAKVLVNDKWKNAVGGLPVGTFLLCAYTAESTVEEMVLLRVLGPTPLPTDSEVVASMVEYYKEGSSTDDKPSAKIDSYTRYEFMFSGLECRVLGTFYRDRNGRTIFGADVENFFSAHNYSAYKATGRVLEYIVNFRDDGIPGGNDQVRIGEVRYSSSRRFDLGAPVPVYVSTLDFIGKRTALFGMTRTGKSNTVKKLLQAVVELSSKQPSQPAIGQIVFDINGEYANPNQQDAGTAIYDLYKSSTTRFSLLEKEGFEVMKVNFHRDIEAGFGLIQSRLGDEGDYVKSFLATDLAKPDDDDIGLVTRWERLIAAYRACLFRAGFDMGSDKIRFTGCKELNELAGTEENGIKQPLDPKKGLTGDEAVRWFTTVWEQYETEPYLVTYKKRKGHEWANDDLKAVLVMLTRKRKPDGAANVSGYRKLDPLRTLHSAANKSSFEQAIVSRLRKGEIVIIDLSQGDPELQRTYSERICQRIFNDGMSRFIKNESPNFIQFYFEEAHNLFPKKEEKDLTLIYNRLAKEGAKLRLGLVYATQEVSSISSNVLKNTQNWFVSHLNNSDELREVEKYYDFEDFTDSLLRASDRGFIRMKTYTNPFVVPVQIDRFGGPAT